MKRSIPMLAVLALALSSCRFQLTDYTFTNFGETKITDLKFRDRDDVWDMGDVEPGKSARFHWYLGGEGAPEFSWVSNGTRYTGEGCYYVSTRQSIAAVSIIHGFSRIHCH